MAPEQVDEMVAGDRAGYCARGAMHVEARLEKMERRVRVVAHASVALEAPCGRCLSPVRPEVAVDFGLTLVPADEYEDEPREARKDRRKAPPGGSFEPADAEEETYSGKVIDLDPLVREQFLLSLPEYPVCKDGCKGLCPACGANLNDRECGCDRHVPDPRWAALKNVKLQ